MQFIMWEKAGRVKPEGHNRRPYPPVAPLSRPECGRQEEGILGFTELVLENVKGQENIENLKTIQQNGLH
ncbi:MAG: hypothetical protein ACE10O_07745, partial [Candidatus Acidiferrales bacterium]